MDKKTAAVLLIVCVWLTGCGIVRGNKPHIVSEQSTVPTLPNTLPELIAALSGYNDEVRVRAAYKIADWGPDAVAAVPALIENVRYEYNSEVRISAARALGAIGPAAKSAAPALIDMLHNQTYLHDRLAAVEALGKIGNVEAVPALVQYLENKDIAVEVARSLGFLTGQEFPDLHSRNISIDENGVPRIVTAAQIWWNKKGQYQDWSELDQLPVTPSP